MDSNSPLPSAYEVILRRKKREKKPRPIDGMADMEARVHLGTVDLTEIYEELRIQRLRNVHLLDQGQPEQIPTLFSVLTTEQEGVLKTRVFIKRVLHDQLLEAVSKIFPERTPMTRNDRIDCINDWLQKKIAHLLEQSR